MRMVRWPAPALVIVTLLCSAGGVRAQGLAGRLSIALQAGTQAELAGDAVSAAQGTLLGRPATLDSASYGDLYGPGPRVAASLAYGIAARVELTLRGSLYAPRAAPVESRQVRGRAAAPLLRGGRRRERHVRQPASARVRPRARSTLHDQPPEPVQVLRRPRGRPGAHGRSAGGVAGAGGRRGGAAPAVRSGAHRARARRGPRLHLRRQLEGLSRPGERRPLAAASAGGHGPPGVRLLRAGEQPLERTGAGDAGPASLRRGWSTGAAGGSARAPRRTFARH